MADQNLNGNAFKIFDRSSLQYVLKKIVTSKTQDVRL